MYEAGLQWWPASAWGRWAPQFVSSLRRRLLWSAHLEVRAVCLGASLYLLLNESFQRNQLEGRKEEDKLDSASSCLSSDRCGNDGVNIGLAGAG